MQYTNLDIEIDQQNGASWLCRARSESSGEASGSLQVAEAMQLITRLHTRYEETRGVVRDRQQPSDPALIKRIGSLLFDALLQGEIGILYQRCLGEIGRGTSGLRIRLHIHSPEIAMLPWEFMYSAREGFLCTSLKTPVVRYLDVLQPIRRLSTSPPVKVLAIIPASQGIDMGREKAAIEQAHTDLGDLIDITYLEDQVTTDRISDQFITEQYHVVHFIGHGGFTGGTPFLQVNTPEGGTDQLPWDQFAKLLKNQVDVKLIVLNSCEGAALASGQSHVGMAPKLVESGIPAVIAMQFAIYDQVAIQFADKFYRSLFKGWARGRVDIAMTHARIALDSAFPNDPALGTPVLFMRAPEGILFDLPERKPVLQNPMSSKLQSSDRTLARAYERNIGLMTKMRDEAPDQDVQQELQQQSLELKKIQKRIKLRRYSMVAAAAIALVVFFFSWMQLFDFLTLDSRVESYTMWLGDQWMEKAFDENIHILSIDASTHAALNEERFGAGYRAHHAALIDSLSKYQAKVIALDVYFNDQNAADDTLAAAIRRAHNRNTHVIVGAEELPDNQPRISPALLPEIRNGNLRYAILCLGRRLGLATSAPLILQRDHLLHPSLSLEAYAAYHDGKVQDINFGSGQIDIPEAGPDDHTHTQRSGYSFFDTVRQVQVGCPVMNIGDTVASLIVDLTPVDLIRAQTTPYQEVLQGIDLRRFENKIVLIGLQEENHDVFSTRAETTRFGVEFHADALNTLMKRVVIRPFGTTGQILVTMVMALLGAAIRYQWSSRKTRTILLALGILVYLAVTIWVYVEFRLLLNTLYHIAAFLLAYWIAGKIINKFA